MSITKEINSVSMKTLESEARMYGIDVTKGIKKEDLYDLIQTKKLEAQAPDIEQEEDVNLSDVEKEYKKATKLIRVIISSNDPQDAEAEGVFRSITLSNPAFDKLGLDKILGKYVPFDTPWHIPNCLYQSLTEDFFYREKKFVVKGDGGIPKEQGYKRTPTRKYNIELLEPLNKSELKNISTRQLAEQVMEG